jgi:hypothetical protein
MSLSHAALSVLFADLPGSARLRQKLGDGEAARAVDRCRKRMERAAEVFGGQAIAFADDRLTAIFEDADQAFQAALQMRERVADLPPVAGIKLAIRAGLTHGTVDEAADAAMQLARQAKPGQLLASPLARAALSLRWQKSTRELATAAADGTTIFELIPAADSTPAVALVLRYGDAVVILDANKRVIAMGRDADCDVAIRDRRASRQHARIELRGERIVLIDNSTNGTYVTLDGQPELFLRGNECVIHGRGLISFAASSSSPGADCATFE